MSLPTGAPERPAWMKRLAALTADYGMFGALLALCLYFTVATYHSETPSGKEGGELLASEIAHRQGWLSRQTRIIVVSQSDEKEMEFAHAVLAGLTAHGFVNVASVSGDPPAVRESLDHLTATGGEIGILAATPACRNWTVFDRVKAQNPAFAHTVVVVPGQQRQSTFLSPGNLRNVADQITVIAIMAVGMTLVIITGGIDLSVGSLVALSAVVAAWLISAWGGKHASGGAMFAACLLAIAVCGVVGLFSGTMIMKFHVPPFIASLAMMQVASGIAFIIAQGQSIYAIPPSFTWLGRGAALFSLPNAVILMVLIYVGAHVLMTRTSTGRMIYAVGGNIEAARLSGLPVGRVLLFVYAISGLTAGIGGVITASQLKAGVPTYGVMYELYVIAAVVVGGTSLSGGKGRIVDTIIGAFIIAVIRNGMNLMNVEPYTQKVVLGLVILGAVLLDMLKRRRGSGRSGQ